MQNIREFFTQVRTNVLETLCKRSLCLENISPCLSADRQRWCSAAVPWPGAEQLGTQHEGTKMICPAQEDHSQTKL